MFDIGLGIDSEISGYDNIRLRGMILTPVTKLNA
jgi:ABC-2 type transport system ATP-binding protein/lipopolysaccharide transport system ATP-binding protein